MDLRTKSMAAAVLATAATAVALPALTQAQSSEQTITAREKVRSVTFVHQKRTTKGQRLATGDRVLTRQAIFDAAGKPSGTLFTDCANVGAPAAVFKATLQCTTTYRFANGQIVAAGVLNLGGKPSIPIVSGTGAYRGVRGVTQTGPAAKGFDSVDVLRFTN